jgi:signal transduction histidine kinase
VFSIYTLWVPIYGIEGIVKAITAAASIVTAVMLWPLIPKILAILTAEQLREAHVALEEEGKHRRASETLLQRFQETEIRQAQKMEAVGQLTGGIAHDFNNILTVITGTIEILGEAVENSPDLAEIAQLITDAAARGAALTQHLLAFARKQPLQPIDVDVNRLMPKAIELLRPTIDGLINIEFVPEGEVLAALVDPNQLTTAVLNLALNARDAMPNGGSLVFRTGNIELSDESAKTCDGLAAGKYVTISIGDTGQGIVGPDLPKVFDPFFTTKEVGKGTGLGLSMVYGFVKQSGGHIAIESEKGRGTTVRIYLPQIEGTAMPAMDSRISESPRGGHGTILIVEGDALVRTYVITQIRSPGYTTLSAGNAQEALSVLRSSDPIDLLFTEGMPGSMNGRELSIEALKLRPTVKVLFTSGFTENAIDQDGRQTEAYSCWSSLTAEPIWQG